MAQRVSVQVMRNKIQCIQLENCHITKLCVKTIGFLFILNILHYYSVSQTALRRLANGVPNLLETPAKFVVLQINKIA